MNSKELYSAFYNCSTQDAAVSLLSQHSYTTVNSAKEYTLLHRAAAENWTRVCQLLINQYQIDPDCSDTTGCTPLHLACIKNNTDTVSYLLLNGYCDPLIKNNNGDTPFDCSSGSVKDFLEDIIC